MRSGLVLGTASRLGAVSAIAGRAHRPRAAPSAEGSRAALTHPRADLAEPALRMRRPSRRHGPLPTPGGGGEPALPLAHTSITQATGAAPIGSGREGGKAEAELALSMSSPRRVTLLHMRVAADGKRCPALRSSSRPNWLLGTRVRYSRPHWLSGARVPPLAPTLAAGPGMRAAICSQTRSETRRDVTCRSRALRARPAVRARSAPLVCRPPACRCLRAGPAAAAPPGPAAAATPLRALALP